MRACPWTRPSLFLLPFVSLTLTFGGCSNAPPIDPSAMAEQAALHAREVVHQAGGGVAFTESSDSGLAKILTGMGHASDGLAGMASMLPPGMMSAMSTSPMGQAAAGMPSLQTTQEQFDGTADDLRTWVRQRILADANLESKTTDEAVYLLRTDPTCRALPRSDDLPGTAPALNAHCVDQLTKVEVRVLLRADGDGVRLGVRVGPDRLELLSLVIHSNLIAVEAELAKAHAASQFVDEKLGTDSPMGSTQFETLTGGLRVSLRKDGDQKATFSLSVLSAIHVAEKSATGALGPDVQLAATDPAVALSVDGVAQTATLNIDIGALEVLTDWNPNSAAGHAANRDLRVTVGALTATTTFAEGTDELLARGLGIGPTSVHVRGVPIFDLGLNPADRHRFDLRVTVDAEGQPRFAVTPRFDLSLGFHLAALTAEFTSAPPSYTLDETYGVRLDNGGAAAIVSGAPAGGAFMGGLKVAAGTLTLSSSKVATPITVSAGRCLTGVASPPADAHPILGALAAVDCP